MHSGVARRLKELLQKVKMFGVISSARPREVAPPAPLVPSVAPALSAQLTFEVWPHVPQRRPACHPKKTNPKTPSAPGASTPKPAGFSSGELCWVGSGPPDSLKSCSEESSVGPQALASGRGRVRCWNHRPSEEGDLETRSRKTLFW